MAKMKKTKATKTTYKAQTANNNSTANNSYSSKANKATFSFPDMSQYMNGFASQAKSFNAGSMQQMVEQFMQTSQKNMEVLTACTQMAVESAKELMEDNAKFANKLLQESASTMQEAFTSGNDPKDKMEEIAEYTKYIAEKTATHARKTAEESMQTAQKIGQTLSKRVSESLEEIRSAA